MRKTTRLRKRPRSNVLEVRVMSPRIAWLQFVGFLGGLFKIACVFAVLTAAGWGVWRGIQRAFYQNPDFTLQVIDLNPNPAVDEMGLVRTAGIDLQANLFSLDVKQIAESLEKLPSISSATAERHLPNTLVVRVKAREPRAWVVDQNSHEVIERKPGALLVDQHGSIFPCAEHQFDEAEQLPVVLIPVSPEHPLIAGGKITQSQLTHCFRLLDAACAEDPQAIHWIESISQSNEWSLLLVTRGGTAATFSLGDHQRQIANLRAALDHAHRQGYSIATINLIPRENVPITVRDETVPRAIPVPEPTAGEIRQDRRSRDLEALLNR
ncbi:FtsQ-type POTRA domain-containing protein [Luteolibacter pohnpeiensis]|uniref:FtsQ-type POTRA domain-containing protein n=1 Tax=Luteolibacter pohnpeiensis TaxID=454153 RepID=A0A934S954_9BACT|nr:FtsQ-type POTRA domain-containing protein [Luteolibacter pohnpeiensis]MBK1883141.1 FtsQ-type POTRA domain-containing protein [Luteolibacter pohnpeiensis]